jgi:hypothetical protein
MKTMIEETDFIKTNLEAPEVYDTAEIHVTAFDHWDNIPSALYLTIECKDGDKVVHTVARTKTLYMDVRATDAICRDIVTILRIFTKIAPPQKEVVLYVHHLAAFLALTRSMVPYSNTLRDAIAKARKALRQVGVPVRLILGSGELRQDFQEYCITNNRQSGSYVPTMEMLGVHAKDFSVAQRRKRLELVG